jgi:hypothetical protein
LRIVEKAEKQPARCAAIPFLGNQYTGGFVDTGQDMPGFDQHVYLSRDAVEQANRLFGGLSRDEAVALHAKVASLEREIERLEEDNKGLNDELGAIDFLGSREWQARKKAGRPRKQQPEAA